jgi:hypothetical protein
MTVFPTAALFRYFGTTSLGEKLKWSTSSFKPEELVRTAVSLRSEGIHVFTRAYCRPHFNAEVTSPNQGTKCYKKISHAYLHSLWRSRHALTKLAKQTRSWKRLVEELRGSKVQLHPYGTTVEVSACLPLKHCSPAFLGLVAQVSWQKRLSSTPCTLRPTFLQ